MRIRVLFYKAMRDGHIVDDGISLWTKLFNWNTPPYSHVEIWWPLCGSFSKGFCFTSTMRGEDNGTTVRPASEVLTHPERWDYVEILVDDDIANMAIARAREAAHNNKGYDKWALASFFGFRNAGSEGKDICSEVAYMFLVWCFVFFSKGRPSPRRLYKWLKKLGYRARPLT